MDVLVSDIGMPGTDGYELIRQVRQDLAIDSATTPAVAVTAYARSEDRARAMLAGYQMHIAKPIEPHELAATVASFAGRVQR
jgi:CheY-like chemotaxis protein